MVIRILNKVQSICSNLASKFYYLYINKWIQSRSFKKINFRELDCINLKINNSQILRLKGRYYLEHRYDVLGSGWVKNDYDTNPLGVHGFSYNSIDTDLSKFRNDKIHELISTGYVRHDWQKDIKSGYRWSYKDYCKDTFKIIGKFDGIDIKMPWEMARFYHLPYIALLGKSDSQYCTEFKDQILDFYLSNPIGLGVNWSCTMDVGIRTHNMLMSYSLITNVENNHIFDNKFEEIFSEIIIKHGRYIYKNLENKGAVNNNHYLADLLGLISISYFSIDDEEAFCWLDFAYNELLIEFDKQFYEEGTNFEGSTAYHCLSSEIYVLFTSYILGLNDDIKFKLKKINSRDELFSKHYIDKLYRTGLFIKDIMKSNGHIVQVGDNDSGMIFKLSSVGQKLTNREAEKQFVNLKGYCEKYGNDEVYWDEDLLNKQYLLARYHALFEDDIFLNYHDNETVEYLYIKEITKGNIINISNVECFDNKTVTNNSRKDLKYKTTKTFPYSEDINLLDQIEQFSYYNFGIYGFSSNEIHLVLSIADNGLKGKGGHAHNDKLSFDLEVNGIDVFSDPGTYLYHPIKSWRNYFRSTGVHNTIQITDWVQNEWRDGKKGIFRLGNNVTCEILLFRENKIIARLIKGEVVQERVIEIFSDKIIVEDSCNIKFSSPLKNSKYFSPGYGKLMKR